MGTKDDDGRDSPTPFAKLADTEFGQCLIEVRSGEEGPEVRMRIDRAEVAVEMTLNGYGDDDAAWEKCQKALDGLDPDVVAKELARQVDELLAPDRGAA